MITAANPSVSCKESDKNEINSILLEPYNYLLANPGKGFRTELSRAFNRWLKVPDDQLAVISEVMEMLHTASLLIDDIQDNSQLRRGTPVAHRVYGIPITINCANYVYFLALDRIKKLNNPKLLNIFTEELLSLHRGQGMELHCRDRSVCPTEAQYLEMVSDKTGGLLRLGIKMMQELSGRAGDFVTLVDILGRIYQIRDDYLNLKTSEYHNKKGYCEDLTEGKYSFPVIHSLRTSKDPSQLENILKQRTDHNDMKKYALKLMEETGSFDYTRDYLQDLITQACRQLLCLGGNKTLEALLTHYSQSL